MKKRLIITIILTFLLSNICFAYPNVSVTNFSTRDKLYQEVSMLSLNSTAMLVRGAKRYLDDDNLKLTPKLIDARTYVTVDTAEMLFNAYTENNETHGTLDFRIEDFRLLLNKGAAEINGESQRKNEYLIYINGAAYMPLRKLAELFGETVSYIDGGYILIGKSENINEIISNDTYLNYGKTELDKFIPVSGGREIYVSPDADYYSADGTMEKPYKTIKQVNAIAMPGDTIYLREGTYYDTINPANNGTPSNPITYKAYNNEEVVISAAYKRPVKGFTSADGKIAEVACSIDLGRGRNQVYYKGKALAEARFPNINPDDYTASDISPLFPTKGNLKLDYSDSNYVVTSSNGYKTSYKVKSDLLKGDEDGKWVGATFVSLHGGAWNWGSAIVNSSTNGSFTVDPNSVSKKWWFDQSAGTVVTECGYLTGHKNAIDVPGEWTISGGKLYIYLPEGETAESLSVEVKEKQLCADLRNKKYIQLDGLKMMGGSITMNDSVMCVVKNCDMKYTSQFDYSLDQREGYIEDNDNFNTDGAPQRGEVGVYISGTDNVFRNCTINETAGAALYLTGLYTLVENNEFINCGYAGSTVGGIYIGTVAWSDYDVQRGGYIIKYNTVRNVARSALTLQTTENKWNVGTTPAVYIPCEISYNEFSNGGIASCDSAVVYLWGATMGNTERVTQLHHNVVYMDCISTGKLHGFIYHDNFMNTMETRDNLIFYSEKNLSWGAKDDINDTDLSIYIQDKYKFPTSYAVIDCHDNKNAGYVAGGLSAIPEESYPEGLYFKSGVKK